MKLSMKPKDLERKSVTLTIQKMTERCETVFKGNSYYYCHCYIIKTEEFTIHVDADMLWKLKIKLQYNPVYKE